MANKEPLIVLDRNNGKWYLQDEHRAMCHMPKGKPFVRLLGDGVCVSHGDALEKYTRMTLTPCEAPIEYTLGCNALALVPEEDRDRATGDFGPVQPQSGKSFLGEEGIVYDPPIWTENNRIILAPPAPDPKGPEELLADIVNARDKLKCLTGDTTLSEALDAADAWHAAQPEQ